MNSSRVIVLTVTLAMAGCATQTAMSAADSDIVDARLLERYASMLEQIRSQLTATLPQTSNEARVRALLADSALDAMLVRGAVLRDGTPEGLARFAQQSKENEQLIEQLLVDTELMKQMLVADGPRNIREGYGHYGPAMKIFNDIQKANRYAGEGVLQRLSLAVALVYSNHKFKHDPLTRYRNFEKAYRDGELDPGFQTLDTWNLRYVVNGQEKDEESSWAREMLRNYRPDHILTSDCGSRYSGVVRSNVHYGSTRQMFDRPELSNFQNILMNGGICGRRAFFGQFICRAFGVPSIKRPSKAHGALARWTPQGWVVNLGPGWGSGHTDTIYSKDKAFLQSSQARKRGDAFLQVKRAQWIAAIVGEPRFSVPRNGTWTQVAANTQARVIKEAKIVTLAPVDEKFGEADDLTIAEEVMVAAVKEADKQITYTNDRGIVIPAVAYSMENGKPSRVTPMKSFSGGMQVYLGPFNRKGVNLLRGGSETSPAANCSSYRRIRSARMGNYPNWGFRVAVTARSGVDHSPALTLDIGGGITLDLVYIKPGTFTMGGYREKTGTFDCAEVPKHDVEITRGYYIGATEVTMSQVQAIKDPGQAATMKNGNFPAGSIHIDAAEWFCKQASDRTGEEVRLPTEAEWEYAARAGRDADWFFGDDPATLGEYAWFRDNSDKKLQPVRQKKPNPWGLYDVYGNVWERVADIYDAGYFSSSPRRDPTGAAGKDPQSRVVYTVNVPRVGEYSLTARVVTMNYDQVLNVAANDASETITMLMPFTCGMWKESDPAELTLKRGENVLRFSRTHEPQFGMAVKSFTLKLLE